MRIQGVIWIGLSGLIFSGCTSTPPIKNAKQVSAPVSPVKINGTTIKVTQAFLPSRDEKHPWYKERRNQFASGIQSYLDTYSENWQVKQSGEAQVYFSCDREYIGSTNCSDVQFTCSVATSNNTQNIQRKFISNTCGSGGVTEDYYAEAFAHGLKIAKPLLETLSTFSEFHEETAEKAYAEAIKKAGKSQFIEIIDKFKGTKAAQKAKLELDKRTAEEEALELERKRQEAEEERLYGDFRRAYIKLTNKYKTPNLEFDRQKSCGSLNLKNPPKLPRTRSPGEYPKQSQFEAAMQTNAENFEKHYSCVVQFLENADYQFYAEDIEQDIKTESELWKKANFNERKQNRLKIQPLADLISLEEDYLKELEKRFNKTTRSFESEWNRQVKIDQEYAEAEARRKANAIKQRKIAAEKKKCIAGLAARNALTIYSSSYCESQAKKGVAGYDAAIAGSANSYNSASRASSQGYKLPSYLTNPYEMPKFDLSGMISNAKEAARTGNPNYLWDKSGNIRTERALIKYSNTYHSKSIDKHSSKDKRKSTSSIASANVVTKGTTQSYRDRAMQAVNKAKANSSYEGFNKTDNTQLTNNLCSDIPTPSEMKILNQGKGVDGLDVGFQNCQPNTNAQKPKVVRNKSLYRGSKGAIMQDSYIRSGCGVGVMTGIGNIKEPEKIKCNVVKQVDFWVPSASACPRKKPIEFKLRPLAKVVHYENLTTEEFNKLLKLNGKKGSVDGFPEVWNVSLPTTVNNIKSGLLNRLKELHPDRPQFFASQTEATIWAESKGCGAKF